MREEVDRVIGSKSQITHDDLLELEYTSCVFKEALRKWPIASELSRETHEDIEINGIKIPKNTSVLVFWIESKLNERFEKNLFKTSAFIMGRNPEYFPEPDKFIPERFLKTSDFSDKNKYIKKIFL